MNWNRGLHRIYLILSLGWIVYTLVVIPISIHNGAVNSIFAESYACIMNLPVGTPQYDTEKKKCDDIREVQLRVTGGTWEYYSFNPIMPELIRALLLPVAVYVVVAPIVWFISRGFRNPKTHVRP